MLPFQIRRFKDRDGEEVVLLIPRGGEPSFYPNAFVTSDYRNTGKSPNTCEKVLRSIGMAIMWAESGGQNLDWKLAEGDFLTYTEADDLARFLGLSVEEQEQERRPAPTTSERRGSVVMKLEAFRPQPTNPDKEPKRPVSDQELSSRLRWVARYAEWHLTRRIESTAMSGQSTSHLKESGKAAISRLRELAPTISGFIDDDKALEAPDPEVIRRIDDILNPKASENPFKSDFVKLRNFVIWRLLRDTGARREEIQSAKSVDVTINPPRLKIKNAKGDSQRTVAFRPSTAAWLDDYIMKHWAALPHGSSARTIGYLFCDQNGRHLSLRAMNRIFEEIRKRLNGQQGHIAPHAMRRFWNHLFSLQIDSMPPGQRISPEDEARMRTRIMGWSTDNQAKRYNRRHIREAGDKIAQEMMDRLDADSGMTKKKE